MRSARSSRDPLDQAGFGHLVGDFADDDLPGAVVAAFHGPSGAQAEAAAAGLVGGGDRRLVLDEDAAVGKSGPVTNFSSSSVRASGWWMRWIAAAQISPTLCGGMPLAMPTAIPEAPLASRFGKRAGSTTGSLFLAVVGRAEIDRVLVDAPEQASATLVRRRLGVAHRGGVIAVDIAEIALPLDQRIARAKSCARRTSAS